jgi:hypothetical protein
MRRREEAVTMGAQLISFTCNQDKTSAVRAKLQHAYMFKDFLVILNVKDSDV